MIMPMAVLIGMAKGSRQLLWQDAKAAYKVTFPGSRHHRVVMFYRLMVDVAEFRNIFYFRAKAFAFFAKVIFQPVKSLEISDIQIGGGIFVEHGTSTYINAAEIGMNFSAKQNVTVGWSDGRPVIGNNVFVGTGAVVLGPITIGDNVNIGAGAIVMKDVPSNTTVVSPHAFICRRDGRRVHEEL